MIYFLSKKKLFSIAFLFFIGMLFGVYEVYASAPARTIGFQGQLSSRGVPVNNTVNAVFGFYDALSGGTLQGSLISKTIDVTNGYFNTSFSESDLAGIDLNQSLWIEVILEGNTLVPRSTINSVPFAQNSFGLFAYASDPVVGPAGSLYYNTVSKKIFSSDGVSWIDTTGGTTTLAISPNALVVGNASSTNGEVTAGSVGQVLVVNASGTPAWSSGLTVLANGDVGIGTTTPTSKLSIAGDINLTGALKISGSAGANGQVLQTTGTGVQWVSTSTLGFLTMSDLSPYLSLSAWTSTTTDALTEGTSNLYFTDARARNAVSSTATGLTYSTSTGQFTLTSGYSVPLTASTTEWAAGYASSTIFSSFYITPSSRITAGAGLEWTGNTLANSGVLSIGGLTGDVATSSLGIVSSQWVTDSSNISYTTGNVGIGTTNANDRLIIKSGSSNSNPLNILNSSNSSIFRIGDTVTGAGLASLFDSTGTEAVRLFAEGSSYFNGGNVIIGTSTPSSAKLGVELPTSGDYVQFGSASNFNSELRLASGRFTSNGNSLLINGKALNNVTQGVKIQVNDVDKIIANSNNVQVSVNANNNNAFSVTSGSSNIHFKTNSSGWLNQINFANSTQNNVIGDISGGTFGLQTNGIERLRIDASGNVGIGTTTPQGALHLGSGQLILPTGSASAPSLSFSSALDYGVYHESTWNGVSIGTQGTAKTTITANGLYQRVGNIYNYGGTYSFGSADDLALSRDGANLLALRRGANAQEFRVYNTDSTADEFASLGWINNSNVFGIETEQSGGGTVRNIAFLGGNVGVGTTTPNEKLDVVGNIRLSDATNGLIKWPTVEATTLAGLDFFRSGMWGSRLQVATSTGDLVFYNTSSGVPVEKIRLSTAGSLSSSGSLMSESLILGASATNITRTIVGSGYNGGSKMDAIAIQTYNNGSTNANNRLVITTGPSGGGAGQADVRIENASLIIASSSISGNGTLGIGTTTPSAKLAITGSGTGTGRAFTIANSSNVDKFTILDDGTINLENGNAVLSGGSGNGRFYGITSSILGSGDNTYNANNGYLSLNANGSGARLVNVSIPYGVSVLNLVAKSGSGSISNGNRNYVQFSSHTTGGNERSMGDLGFLWSDVTDSTRSADFSLKTVNGGALGEVLRITSAGNVGIGTTTPYAKLSVAGQVVGEYFTATSTGKTFIAQNNGASYLVPQLSLESYNTGVSLTGNDEVYLVGNNIAVLAVKGAATPLARMKSNTIFGWTNNTANGSLDTGLSRYTANTIAIGNGTSNDYSGTLIAGNIGIGTTAPSGKLEIVTQSNSRIVFSQAVAGTENIPSGQTGLGSKMTFSRVSDGALGVGNLYVSDGSNFNIAASSNTIFSNGAVETIRIATDGSLGIGTSSPSTTLAIKGISGKNVISVASSSGASLLSMLQNGNVGIGIASPANKLEVAGTGVFYNGGDFAQINSSGIQFQNSNSSEISHNTNGQPLIFKTNSGAGRAERLRITSAGNIGIGTTSPAYKLSISSTLGDSAINLYESGYGGSILLQPRGYPTGQDQLHFQGNGGQAIRFTVGASSGRIEYDGTNFNLIPATGALAVGNWTTSVSGKLSVDSSASSAFVPLTVTTHNSHSTNFVSIGKQNAPGGIMIINSSGNVGIGTTTPSSLLNVYGINPKLTLEGSTNTSPSVIFKNSSGSIDLSLNSSRDLAFNDLSAGNRLVIRSNGNIGIGDYYSPSNYPQNKLSVAGSASIGYATGADVAAPANGLLVNGGVGIGTTTPAQKLVVVGNAQFTGVGSSAYASDLNLTADGTLTTSASDIRLKENILALASTTLDKLLALKTYTFTWKSDTAGKVDIGMIAQEVEEIFPEITFTNRTDGYKGINYSRLNTLLVRGMQEQQVHIDELKKYATFIRTKELHTEKLCIGEDNDEVCINKEQLRSLLQSAVTPQSAPSTSSTPTGGSDSSANDTGTSESPQPDEVVPVENTPTPEPEPVPEPTPEPTPEPEPEPAPAPTPTE